MGLAVYWLQLAEDKLEEIFVYYKFRAGKKQAQKLIEGIIAATTVLESQPKIGRLETVLQNKRQEFRFLIYKNYKIVYWVNSEFERVEIVNVFDTRQNPEKIREI